MKRSCRLLIAIAASLCLTSFIAADGQVMTARFKSIDANANAYYEYLPRGYNPNDTFRYPLIAYIIGAGDLGAGTPSTITLMLRSGPPEEIKNGVFPDSVKVNGKTFKFLMIGPQWKAQPTVADVTNFINFCIANYKVDTTRIYLTGLSMGGGVTWQYAGSSAAAANRLAGIVPVCGEAAPDSNRARIIAAANLPVWATHNDRDPSIPVQWTEQMVSWINNPPPPVPAAMETIFHNNVHDAWTATYAPTLSVNNMNIYQWMVQYSRVSTAANLLPVVNAGASQSISPPVFTAALSGTASDSLGTIIKTTWTFVSGPATPVIGTPNSLTTSVTGLTASGVYVFSLSVTDSRNLTVAANTQITVLPPPTGPNRTINVDLYGFNNPFGNSAWNDWNVSGSLSSARFNYSDGSPSNLSAVLSAQTGVADNGTSYVTTMCPQHVGRYASYYSGSGGRTLTLSGMDSTKLYRLDLYASRSNPSQTTTFATSGTSVTIATNNNLTQVGTIDNLRPVNGKLAVTLTHGQLYDYLNGITITEKTVINPNTPPVANAGADQSISLPVDSVTLDGSASKGANPIVAYQWSILSGPGGLLETPAAVRTVLTNLSAGTYRVQLRVTDDSNRAGMDTVNITVNAAPPPPPPPPPVANAGPNRSITLPLDSVTLSAAASTGKDPIVAYRWSVLSGPAGASLTRPDSVTTILDGLKPGIYQVLLRVTDDSNMTGLDTVSITVISPAVNQPPLVIVGPNQTITGSSTTLTSTVTDPENMISSLQWTRVAAPGQRLLHIGVIGSSTMFGTGPANIDSSLVNRIKRYYRAAGIIDTVYNLAVGGSTVYNGVTADFISPGPNPNTYDPTANVTAALAKGIDVLIVGYPTNLYEIGQLTIPEILAAHQNIFNAANAAGVRCYITTTQPRTSSFDTASQARLLVIRDSLLNRFGEFCMDFMTPMVYPGTYAVLPQYAAGDGIHLNSAAHAQLAHIVEATNPFKYIVSPIATIGSPAAVSTAITGLDTGIFKFQMAAFDQYKLASSAIIAVTAGNAPPPPPLVPVANAGPDQAITLPNTSVSLTGSGSESGGKIVAFAWTQVSGATAAIVTPNAATTNISNLTGAGVYNFSLTVTDSLGAKASDTVTVTVNPAPQTQSRIVNVAIYSFNNPYSNAAWNAWNLGGTSLASGTLKYSDGTSSTISAALSAQTAVADNGVSYVTVTMCPQQAARFPSYYSGSGGRSLTLSGLDSTKLYRIDLYATRSNPNQTTTFAVGATKVSISTNNNTASVATFDNLIPASGGKLVVALTHAALYDYLNGFTLTEKTVVAPTSMDSTVVTAAAPGIIQDSGAAS
ncbi:MAG TPA: PKD domain-containing protein, partial [Puia sp.]|nr:PKD domain-containing protein [Puia sp.]